MTFSMSADGQSKISEEGLNISAIDKELRNEKVSLIKMDIEGSELKAFEGAKGVIKHNLLVLAICIYHSNEDLWRIPLWIKENFQEYKLYIRAHSDLGAEVVVYAVNKRKNNLIPDMV